MRSKIKLFQKCIFILLVLIVSPRAFAVNDAIIAIVNDNVITLKDLNEFLNSIYMQMMADGKKDSEIEETMKKMESEGLQKLIEQKLLVDEANREGMTIRQSFIDDRINDIKKKFKTNQEFENAMGHDGITLGDLRNRIIDQFKTKFIVERAVKDKIFVNPQEVTDYYQQHMTDFQKPERVDLDSIFIPYDEEKKTWAIKADQVLQKIRTGTDFSEAAKEYSKAPSIGLVERGQLLSDLENAIFKLNVGEVSSALQAENGVYIFKVKAKYPPEATSLKEAKDEIYKIIFQRRFSERYQEWLEKLRKAAYVEIKK